MLSWTISRITSSQVITTSTTIKVHTCLTRSVDGMMRNHCCNRIWILLEPEWIRLGKISSLGSITCSTKLPNHVLLMVGGKIRSYLPVHHRGIFSHWLSRNWLNIMNNNHSHSSTNSQTLNYSSSKPNIYKRIKSPTTDSPLSQLSTTLKSSPTKPKRMSTNSKLARPTNPAGNWEHSQLNAKKDKTPYPKTRPTQPPHRQPQTTNSTKP